MNKITLKDIFIILTAVAISIISVRMDITVSQSIASTIFVTLLTLVAFLFSIAALSVNFWDSSVLVKLKESGHYFDFIHTLKRTIYLFIFTGFLAFLYGVFFKNMGNIIQVISCLLLFLSIISFGYLALNVRRIFVMLEEI